MSQSDDRWQRADELFQAALDLPNEERAAFLDQECGSDQPLRELVDRLLRLSQTDDEWLPPAGGVADAGEALAELPSDLQPTEETGGPSGARRTDGQPQPHDFVGPYRIRGKIGEGGFGEVYEAEQLKPVRRVVALKVLKAGMDSRAVLARFDAERQALALMDHPNIAKIFDAGQTEQGRPYFVMEHISGEPLHRYADRLKLETRARLDLVVQVCRAIQHAHSKGIIHRDLKPSNVLIAEEDGQAVPKVIDFGIAKATAMPLTAETLHTMPGQLIGTPAYMSPERLELSGVGVDTRSDTYSIGVILYELLTGTLPFEAKSTAELRLEDQMRRIREETPAPPSQRVQERTDTAGAVAESRQTEPGALQKELRGELDWITMKALAKEPHRRYETTRAMARDIERFLAGDAVEAGPPSTMYRFVKFARRHRVAIGALSVIFLSVVVAAASLAFALVDSQRQRERTEAALAEAEDARTASDAVTGFLIDMLTDARPSQVDKDVTVRDVLDRATEGIGDALADRPAVEARIRQTIGTTYHELGVYDTAEEHLDRSYQLFVDTLGEENKQTLSARFARVALHREQGRLEEARDDLRGLHEIERTVFGPESKEYVETTNELAAVLTLLGDYEGATPLLKYASERAPGLWGEQDRRALTMRGNYGIMLRLEGRLEEALEIIGDAVTGFEESGQGGGTESLAMRNALAGTYYSLGRYEEGVVEIEDILEQRTEVLGPEHPEVYGTKGTLAVFLGAMGEHDRAIALNQEVLDFRRRVLGSEHHHTLQSMNNLGSAYMRVGDFESAVPLLRESVSTKLRTLGPDHVETLASQGNLANALANTGEVEEAVRLMRRAYRKAEATLDPTHRRRLILDHQRGVVFRLNRDWEEAEAALLTAVEGMAAAYGEDHERTTRARTQLIGLYEDWGKTDAAAEWRSRSSN